MIQYETERLYLRDFEENDLEAVYDYAGSFENTTYLMWGPHSREEVKAFIDDAICGYESDDRDNRPHAKWAVVLKDTGELIGGCNLAYSADHGEMGWVLNRRFQRKGYCVEMGIAMLKFGFETLGLHRIIAHCDTDNYGSWRVMEKMGMRREAHFLEKRPANKLVRDKQRYSDEFEYAILDREWFEK